MCNSRSKNFNLCVKIKIFFFFILLYRAFICTRTSPTNKCIIHNSVDSKKYESHKYDDLVPSEVLQEIEKLVEFYIGSI